MLGDLNVTHDCSLEREAQGEKGIFMSFFVFSSPQLVEALLLFYHLLSILPLLCDAVRVLASHWSSL